MIITRLSRLVLCLACAIALSVPVAAQTLDDLTAEGGTRILREGKHLDKFLAQLELLRPGVTARPKEEVSPAQGTRLHKLYRLAWVDYLDAQGAEKRRHDFLGRKATGTIDGRPGTRVYRLKNYEIWLEHSVRGTGDRHSTDLIVWELDIDSDGKVKGARGVSADLHTRHPLDRMAGHSNRSHFRIKAHVAEAHVQDVAGRGIRVDLDSHPDRAFYYQDYLLGRGNQPGDRFSVEEVPRDENFWYRKTEDKRDRRGLDATRRIIGLKQNGPVDAPSRLTAAPVDTGHGGRLPRLRTGLIGAGIALASLGLSEANAVMAAVSDPSLTVGRLFHLYVDEDWERLDRLLSQSTISNDVMGDLAHVGSYSAVYADQILDYLRKRVREVTQVLYFDGHGAQIRLGDGKYKADSSTARELGPIGTTQSRWTGRIRLPEPGRIRGLKLVFTELRGIDRGLRVELGPGEERAVLTTLGDGRNVSIPLDVPADGVIVVKVIANTEKQPWDEFDIDDLTIVSPSVEYFLGKEE
jgi:hypothetical protein